MNGQVKILILEHDPNDIELMQYELKRGNISYVYEIVQTEDSYRKALIDFAPEIVLSDFSLPGFDGLSAFHIKSEICPDIPFIFVSGTIGEERTVELIKNGVTDYVLKDKLFTLNPKIARAIKEARDLAEKKQAEQEILKLNLELEERVRLRTEELVTANQQLEAFSYSVSHDLRSPLRSIHGFAQILERNYSEVLDEKGHELLAIIRTNTSQMQNLIEDMLVFSRLGKMNMERADVDMNKLVESVWNNITEGISCVPQLKMKDLPTIKGDAAMLTQVWVNFISNAVKYSSKKSNPVVEIGAEHCDNETIFYVKDNGAGFDMQYYDKLFAVFQRLHGANEFEGTGVGLAIVKHVIEKHEGRVWAESKVDDGSTFYFSVPDYFENELDEEPEVLQSNRAQR